jgi:hypothetical protein
MIMIGLGFLESLRITGLSCLDRIIQAKPDWQPFAQVYLCRRRPPVGQVSGGPCISRPARGSPVVTDGDVLMQVQCVRA